MPEIFNKISDLLAKFFNPFKNEVKIPAKIIINPCPKENKSNIETARIMFLVNVAKLIMLAKTGVEHGLEARANKAPIIKG